MNEISIKSQVTKMLIQEVDIIVSFKDKKFNAAVRLINGREAVECMVEPSPNWSELSVAERAELKKEIIAHYQ